MHSLSLKAFICCTQLYTKFKGWKRRANSEYFPTSAHLVYYCIQWAELASCGLKIIGQSQYSQICCQRGGFKQSEWMLRQKILWKIKNSKGCVGDETKKYDPESKCYWQMYELDTKTLHIHFGYIT